MLGYLLRGWFERCGWVGGVDAEGTSPLALPQKDVPPPFTHGRVGLLSPLNRFALLELRGRYRLGLVAGVIAAAGAFYFLCKCLVFDLRIRVSGMSNTIS